MGDSSNSTAHCVCVNLLNVTDSSVPLPAYTSSATAGSGKLSFWNENHRTRPTHRSAFTWGSATLTTRWYNWTSLGRYRIRNRIVNEWIQERIYGELKDLFDFYWKHSAWKIGSYVTFVKIYSKFVQNNIRKHSACLACARNNSIWLKWPCLYNTWMNGWMNEWINEWMKESYTSVLISIEIILLGVSEVNLLLLKDVLSCFPCHLNHRLFCHQQT